MTTQTLGAERRRHPRFEFLGQVRMKRTASDLLMALSNISKSGALVDMGTLRQPSWVGVGRVIEVSIVHPETLESIEIHGRVVRVLNDLKGTRFAVEFVDIDDATEVELQTWLAHASPTPPPLPAS